MEGAARRIRACVRVRMTVDQRLAATVAAADGPLPSRPALVAAGLSRQLELYRRLEGLSRRQSTLIEDDDTDHLLAVLGERQAVVDEIAAIGADLEPIRQQWEPFLQSLPPATREQLRALVDTLAELAGLVAGRDEADRERLESRRSAVGRELASLARGRSAVVAYGGKAGTVPFYQDREA